MTFFLDIAHLLFSKGQWSGQRSVRPVFKLREELLGVGLLVSLSVSLWKILTILDIEDS